MFRITPPPEPHPQPLPETERGVFPLSLSPPFLSGKGGQGGLGVKSDDNSYHIELQEI